MPTDSTAPALVRPVAVPHAGARFSPWAQAWRMARRDWRAGELTLLLFALVLAVAALASVGFLSDRMRQGLERDARQLIGADVLLVADQPFDAAFAAQAAAQGLSVAQTVTFPSMATVARPADRPNGGETAERADKPSSWLDGIEAVVRVLPRMVQRQLDRRRNIRFVAMVNALEAEFETAGDLRLTAGSWNQLRFEGDSQAADQSFIK